MVQIITSLYPEDMSFHDYYRLDDDMIYEKEGYFYIKKEQYIAKYQLTGMEDGFGQGSGGKNYLKRIQD